MDNCERFICIPYFRNLTNQGLKLIDTYIYIVLKSFCIDDDLICTCALTEISNRSECSVKIIKNAINRLQNAGYLSYKRDDRFNKNIFSFTPKKGNKLIPESLIHDFELSPKEKAVWIVVNEFVDYEVSFYTPYEMSNIAGLSYRAFKRRFNSLEEKGFLLEDTMELKGEMTSYYQLFDPIYFDPDADE